MRYVFIFIIFTLGGPSMARDDKVDTRQFSPMEEDSAAYKRALIQQLLQSQEGLPPMPYYTPETPRMPHNQALPRLPDRRAGPMVLPGYDPNQVGGGVPGRGN